MAPEKILFYTLPFLAIIFGVHAMVPEGYVYLDPTIVQEVIYYGIICSAKRRNTVFIQSYILSLILILNKKAKMF